MPDYTFDLLAPDATSDPDAPTRGAFLRRLITGGGALLAGGAVLAEFAPTAGAASAQTDITVLNAALILEALGRDFYAESLRNAKLTGDTKTFVNVVHGHEVEHFAFIKAALGRDAKPLPTFDFGSRTHSEAEVQRNAMTFEATCTAALVGVAPLITRKLLAHAGSLLPVEAQHVSWISNIIGASPAPNAFNPKDTLAGVKHIIAPLIAA